MIAKRDSLGNKDGGEGRMKRDSRVKRDSPRKRDRILNRLGKRNRRVMRDSLG